jgi:hypothetical protein
VGDRRRGLCGRRCGFRWRGNVLWFSPRFKRFRASRGSGAGRWPCRSGRRFVFRGRLRTRVGHARNRSRRCRSFGLNGSSGSRRRSGRRRRRRGRRRFVFRGKPGTGGRHARSRSRRTRHAALARLVTLARLSRKRRSARAARKSITWLQIRRSRRLCALQVFFPRLGARSLLRPGSRLLGPAMQFGHRPRRRWRRRGGRGRRVDRENLLGRGFCVCIDQRIRGNRRFARADRRGLCLQRR